MRTKHTGYVRVYLYCETGHTHSPVRGRELSLERALIQVVQRKNMVSWPSGAEIKTKCLTFNDRGLLFNPVGIATL